MSVTNCVVFGLLFLFALFTFSKASPSDEPGIYGLYGFFSNPTLSTSRRSSQHVENKQLRIGYPLMNGTDMLIYYDPSSGNPITIGSTESDNDGGYSLGCFDNINNVFYTLVVSQENSTSVDHQPMGLFGFNLSNPSITQFIKLPMIMTCVNCIGATDVCIADPNTGDIYVYGRSYYDPYAAILVRVTRNSVTLDVNITKIASYERNWHPRISVENLCHIYDSKRNKLWIPEWINGFNLYWYYIDSVTGIIEKNISSIEWEQDMASCVYDAELDVIIALGLNSINSETDDQSYIIRYANPETLELQTESDKIKATKEDYCGMYGSGTFDIENKILYQLIFKMENSNDKCNDLNASSLGYMTGVNVVDGSVETSVPICILWDCPLAVQYWDGK